MDYKHNHQILNEQIRLRVAGSFTSEVLDITAYSYLLRNGTIPETAIEYNTVKRQDKLPDIIKLLEEISKDDYSIRKQFFEKSTEILINVNHFTIRIFLHDYHETEELKHITERLKKGVYEKVHTCVLFTLDCIESPTLKKLVKEFFVKSYKCEEEVHQKQIGMFQKQSSGALTVTYTKLNENRDKLKIDQLYNDDFKEVHENIMAHLTEKEHGLVLLHGEPGTGKTSYIRSLIRENLNKSIIYMPPFMTQMLGSPEFMSFLMNNRNKIYIIEDAETALKTREAGGNEAVANILNASDGIMGDVIKSQFIFTFNCQSDEIDPALTRPGRLLEQYEFNYLTEDKTTALWKEINGDIPQPKERMNLAEIFNHDTTINTQKDKEDEKIGFGFMNTG